MGIGRREFLRQFGAGIAAAATPTAAIAISNNQYINRRLGIAFEKPDEWVFANVQQMADVKTGQILDLNDPELSQMIAEAIELPILTISRDGISADSDRFTPGVTVYLDRITPADASNPDSWSPIENLKRESRFGGTLLKDFRIISRARATIVSACAAAQYEASFTFEHDKMKPTPVRMKTLAIEQGAAFYGIRMYDSPYVGGDMAFDFSPFIASVRMV